MMDITARLDLPLWLSTICWLTSFVGIWVLADVMQMTEHDTHLRRDPPSIRWARRIWFIATIMALGTSALWTSVLTLFVVIWFGLVNLVINSKALKMRRPPDHNAAEYASGIHTVRIRPVAPLSFLRRGIDE